MLEKFLIVERCGEGINPDAYRLVLKRDDDDFVVVTYGTEYDCEVVRGAMLNILEKLFSLKALL